MRELAVSTLIKGEDSLPVTRRIINPCHRGVSCMQDAPCWSARCFSNTPPLLSISLRSCPNDDPRPTFNHYLHCPFNNYSTPLHNFNSRSMRCIPVIVNCLIDTIFWGHVSFFSSHDVMHSKEVMEHFEVFPMTFPRRITYAVSCKASSLPQHLLPSLIEAKLRLHIRAFS